MKNRSILAAGILGLCVISTGVSCRHDDDVKKDRPKEMHPTTAPSHEVASATSQPVLPDISAPGLENAHRVTAKVISGAQPEGDEAFKALHDMGIKTILSVDGAAPDVERAHKYGLTYVHIPITYSGVTEEQGNQIAKALNDVPGPVYLHCHHGKHRSAAAVTVACVENGTLDPAMADAVLKTFGTGVEYKGLWAAAEKARPLTSEQLAAVKVNYVEVSKIPPLADAMVSVDVQFDNLKLIQKSGWKAPVSHPDLDPPHEALQLEEHFREIARKDEVKAKSKEFLQWLNATEADSKSLRDILSAKPINTAEADATMKRIGQSCATCHKTNRN